MSEVYLINTKKKNFYCTVNKQNVHVFVIDIGRSSLIREINLRNRHVFQKHSKRRVIYLCHLGYNALRPKDISRRHEVFSIPGYLSSEICTALISLIILCSVKDRRHRDS